MRVRYALIGLALGAVAFATAPSAVVARPAGLPPATNGAKAAPDPAQLRLEALEALKQQPGDREALGLLGRIYQAFRSHGVTRQQEIQLRAAEIADYQTALSVYPDWPEALYRSAVHRIALHRLEPSRVDELHAAIGELNHALTVLGDNAPVTLRASVLHQRGRAEKHMGDDILMKGGAKPAAEPWFSRALGSFDSALALAPDRIDILGEVVQVEQGRGRSAVALARLESVAPTLAKPGYQAKIWEMIGALRVELNREDAGEALQRALDTNPKAIGSYLNLADWQRRQGDTIAAVATLKRAVAAVPQAIEAWQLLATTAEREGDATAAASYRESLMAVPLSEADFIGMTPSRNLYRNRIYQNTAVALASDAWSRLNDAAKARYWLGRAGQFGQQSAEAAALAKALQAGTTE